MLAHGRACLLRHRALSTITHVHLRTHTFPSRASRSHVSSCRSPTATGAWRLPLVVAVLVLVLAACGAPPATAGHGSWCSRRAAGAALLLHAGVRALRAPAGGARECIII